jgi:hypothetical protein
LIVNCTEMNTTYVEEWTLYLSIPNLVKLRGPAVPQQKGVKINESEKIPVFAPKPWHYNLKKNCSKTRMAVSCALNFYSTNGYQRSWRMTN